MISLEKYKKMIFSYCGKDAVVIATADHPKDIHLAESIDMRSVSPIGIYSRRDKQCIVLQPTKDTEKISFVRPNNIALFLNRYKKNVSAAKVEYKKLFEDKEAKRYLGGRDLLRLFNYFELIQESIISIYTAVEVFANLAIPEDYKFKRKNNRGVEEVWSKNSIERYMSLPEKVGDILPQALKVPSPKKEKFWNRFKELQHNRNQLIHQKTIDDMDIYLKFTKKTTFDSLDSGFKMLLHFYHFDKDNTIFPYKFADNKIPIIEVEDFKQIIE